MFDRVRAYLAMKLIGSGSLRSQLAIALVLLAGGYTCVALAQKSTVQNRFDIALIGDAPYSPQEESQYPNLVADINRSNVAFVVHDGDLQSSGTPCTDDLLLKRRALYQTFRPPFVFILGDNEWTDCHRTGSDPLVRLAKVRELFFATDESLGQTKLQLERQSRSPQYLTYRENVRWVYGSVLFVGLHIVGSNNNLGRTPEMDREFQARNQANLQWLQSSFALAREKRFNGVMVMIQANPGFE